MMFKAIFHTISEAEHNFVSSQMLIENFCFNVTLKKNMC